MNDKEIKKLSKMAHEINDNAKKNKNRYSRPIVEHKHTGTEWSNVGLEIRVNNQVPIIIANVYTHLPSNQSKEEALANARLIAQAPRMVQLCEAFFDMINHTDSIYLPMLAKTLNNINPK